MFLCIFASTADQGHFLSLSVSLVLKLDLGIELLLILQVSVDLSHVFLKIITNLSNHIRSLWFTCFLRVKIIVSTYREDLFLNQVVDYLLCWLFLFCRGIGSNVHLSSLSGKNSISCIQLSIFLPLVTVRTSSIALSRSSFDFTQGPLFPSTGINFRGSVGLLSAAPLKQTHPMLSFLLTLFEDCLIPPRKRLCPIFRCPFLSVQFGIIFDNPLQINFLFSFLLPQEQIPNLLFLIRTDGIIDIRFHFNGWFVFPVATLLKIFLYIFRLFFILSDLCQ